jgi:alpha-D-xyloside xylohydrolase
MHRSICFLVLVLCIGLHVHAQEIKSYEKKSDGVVFDLDEGKMKLQVCTDKMIRVQVTPTDNFSNRKSLIIVKDKWEKVKWSLKNENEYYVLKTDEIKARIKKSTAEIKFYDKQNNLILAEREGSGKRITAANVLGEDTYHLMQQWESPKDECIYGLGHHQHGLLNQRGADIDLWQENWEIVVPFFTSNKGYGILWDNYSHSKFGFPVTADFIPPQNLFSKDGRKGGLTGTYFKGTDLKDLESTRIDSIINFDFKYFGPQIDNSFSTDPNWTDKALHPDIGKDKYSVRWEGQLLSEHAGEYTFNTFTTNGLRLWIDDQLIVDAWNSPDKYKTGKLYLEKNQKYNIRLEWFRDSDHPLHNKRNGAIQLRWAPPAKASFDGITFWSEVGDGIDYHFIYGPELDTVIQGYRNATGKTPLFGKYAYGYWHSSLMINSQDKYLNVLNEFRDRKIPIDILVQDLGYWEPAPWGSHLFDPKRYPDPKSMIDSAHQNNVKYMISVWAMFQRGSENFKELKQKGLLFRYNNSSFWTDKGTWYYNPFNPDGQKTYWKQLHDQLFAKGVDAWWLDASEPEISTPADPFLYKKVMKNNLGTGARYLNAFSLLHTKGIYEGQRKVAPDKRVLILSRSAFAGQQRNGVVTWTGDITARYKVLKEQIVCGLNYSLSGLPYWTTDIGGFFVKKTDWPLLNQDPGYRELYTRWWQFGAFCPIMRAHGVDTSREMWLLGEESEQIQMNFLNLRYRLMPYIYSLAGDITHKDYTIMRALVMDFKHDKNTHLIDDQFMFGPAFLVNPVIEAGVKSRSVYLPNTKGWYDFWTGEFFNGGQYIDAPTPLDTMPLFVKTGSIVPMGPTLQYATEKAADPIELRIYTGEDGHFILYEDENENYNYEKGTYSTIEFSWNENKQTLIIDQRKGNFPGIKKKRTFNIVWVENGQGTGVAEAEHYTKIVNYDGEEIKICRK